MMRIGLFLLTNLAVLVVAGIILSLFGVGSYHGAGGLNLGNLLVICFVFGMVGSLISLFMSKWMAKKATGTQIIDPNALKIRQKPGYCRPLLNYHSVLAFKCQKWAFFRLISLMHSQQAGTKMMHWSRSLPVCLNV